MNTVIPNVGLPTAPGVSTHIAETQLSNKRTFPGVRGARFIAALLVVSYHLRWFDRDVTVSFFFVLSGFILCFSKIDRPADFYRRRFLKVYPMYFAGLILGIPGLIFHFNGLGVLALTPLMLQAWTPSFSLTWNGPGWSLSCLAFFYLLMPFLVRNRIATAILAALLPIALFLPGVYSRLPIVNLPQFCIGVIGGLLFVNQHRFMNTDRLVSWIIPAAICISVIIFVPIPQIALHNGIMAPLFLWLILCLTRAKACPRLLINLGDSSYALIILHHPILFAFKAVTHRPVLPLHIGIIYLFVAISTALIAFNYVDPLLRSFFQRTVLTRRQTPLRGAEAHA